MTLSLSLTIHPYTHIYNVTKISSSSSLRHTDSTEFYDSLSLSLSLSLPIPFHIYITSQILEIVQLLNKTYYIHFN